MPYAFVQREKDYEEIMHWQPFEFQWYKQMRKCEPNDDYDKSIYAPESHAVIETIKLTITPYHSFTEQHPFSE